MAQWQIKKRNKRNLKGKMGRNLSLFSKNSKVFFPVDRTQKM